MKYAIAHDYGGYEGWKFVGEYEGKPGGKFIRTTFDTFGNAYTYAIGMGYSSSFEIFGVFAPEDITVNVSVKA